MCYNSRIYRVIHPQNKGAAEKAHGCGNHTKGLHGSGSSGNGGYYETEMAVF